MCACVRAHVCAVCLRLCVCVPGNRPSVSDIMTFVRASGFMGVSVFVCVRVRVCVRVCVRAFVCASVRVCV